MALLVGLIAATPTPAGAASRPGAALLAWKIRPTPNQTLPNGVLLSDSCAGARACIAVGYHAGGTGPFVALAEAWNGTSWRVLATPTPARANDAQLSDVSCSAADACTAVGFYTNSSGRDLPLVERWNGSRWKIQATPIPAAATVAHLFGVSCWAAAACTAVGSYNSAQDIPFAEAWNGIRWKVQPLPSPVGATSADLTGISCRPANGCTAVGGYTNRSFTLLTLAERWNGTRWRIQVTPNRAGAAGSGLSGVSCSSARACTAVGSSFASGGRNRALAETWNGTRWRIQVTPNRAGTASSGLVGVSCSSPVACTAMGADFAERWNGARWALQITPIPGAVLGGVSCPTRSACTAAGFRQVGTSRLTVAEAWNGTSWRVQATPDPGGTFGGELHSVSCTSASACTAVGFYNRAPFGPVAPLAEAWNGSRWSILAAPSPAGALDSGLSAVSCTSASACIAVGSDRRTPIGPDAPLAEAWNGSRWSILAAPSPPGALDSGLSAVSCTSASACIAVGEYDTSVRTTLAFAEGWDGTSWTIQAVPSPAGTQYSFLRSVSCTSASACTAVGDEWTPTSTGMPLAERWDGTSWSIQAIPAPSINIAQLYAVSCSTAVACIAVGYHRNDNGIAVPLAEVWNGTSWSIQTTPNPAGALGMFLNAVSCSLPDACTAVGTTGDERFSITAEHWDGTRWGAAAMALPFPNASADARAVSCVGATACTAVGDYSRTGTPLTLAETTF